MNPNCPRGMTHNSDVINPEGINKSIMKTPRQILLERHSHAEPKLDLIRQAALASVASEPAPESLAEQCSPGLLVSLGTLLRSVRWHLAALSAIWVILVLLNSEPKSAPSPVMARKTASHTQLMAALRENRRQLLELLDLTATESAPPALVPHPRSELQSPTAMA